MSSGECDTTASSPQVSSSENTAPQSTSSMTDYTLTESKSSQTARRTKAKKPLGQLLLSLQERIDIAKVVYKRPNQGISLSYAGQMTAEGSTSIKNTPRAVVTVIPPMRGNNQPIFAAVRSASSGVHSNGATRAPGAFRTTGRIQTALHAVPSMQKSSCGCCRVHFTTSSNSTPEGR